jgi:hypothetical protein
MRTCKFPEVKPSPAKSPGSAQSAKGGPLLPICEAATAIGGEYGVKILLRLGYPIDVADALGPAFAKELGVLLLMHVITQEVVDTAFAEAVDAMARENLRNAGILATLSNAQG